ncbi:hypothetical protein ElyMa_001905700 [Elysia marginata]|uniref:Uncharacterized protein n=1 Tax=Elysia marginata TaxID=1093978 RepID=A0AAV4ET24_9GAST|nr:hypothetical protein ElyMa_001905700 [Elysia marginata]
MATTGRQTYRGKIRGVTQAWPMAVVLSDPSDELLANTCPVLAPNQAPHTGGGVVGDTGSKTCDAGVGGVVNFIFEGRRVRKKET